MVIRVEYEMKISKGICFSCVWIKRSTTFENAVYQNKALFMSVEEKLGEAGHA